MSIQAVAWVLEHSEATLADRLVLIAIANHADARGWNAYPAVPLIAREARVDRATVFRALEALETLGELLIQRRPGRSSMYGITALGSQSTTGEGSQSTTGEGSQDATGGVANTQKRGRNLQPKPSVTVNEPRGDAVVKLPDPLPDAIRARGVEWVRALRKGPV
jgi:hypothetical protein